MPRAFLVKKRGPARRLGPGVGPETSPTTLKDGATTPPYTPHTIDKGTEGWRPPTLEERPREAEAESPGGRKEDSSRSPERGIREEGTPLSPRTPASGGAQDELAYSGVSSYMSRPGGAPTSGPPLGPPPAAPYQPAKTQPVGKTSPDAALEPERMRTHRSPDAPAPSMLPTMTPPSSLLTPSSSSSSSVPRVIGYITSSPTKTRSPRITIENQRVPEDANRYFYPTPPHPTEETGCYVRSRSPVLRSRSPVLRSRSPVLRPSSPPLRSRSPPPPPVPRKTTLWAPHRDVVEERDVDFRSSSMSASPSSYPPFPSPPSYQGSLCFPSPDLPSPSPPSSAPPVNARGVHHHRYSPDGHFDHFDLGRSLRAAQVPSQRLHVADFDRVPRPLTCGPRPAPPALRTTGNVQPLTPIGGTTFTTSGSHAVTSSSTLQLSPPGGNYLLERGSPRKRSYPPEGPEGVLYRDMYPGGGYENRYGAGGWEDAGGGQSVPLNMSIIKENNGCRGWRDGEVLGERVKPQIPWGIENIPMDAEDLKALVPKKRRENDPPRYQCEACNKSYATHGGLSKHKQFHCVSIIKKEFSCKNCDKTYVSLGALKMHIRTHTLPCKCTICGKAFARPWLLQGHIRTHTGEKPYQCAHCGRSFADRSNLRAHLQTHTDIKKYNCRSCSKSFSRMSLLTKHEDGGCGNSSI